MEGNGRRLGWIAIALGVLALVISLGGRSAPMIRQGYGPQGGPQSGYSYGPPQGSGPQGLLGPQQAPGAPVAPGFAPGWRGRTEFETRHHFGPFFFWPFFLIGGLFRLVLFALLVALILKWLGRGRGWGRPWGGPPNHGQGGPPDQGQSGRPGPEQPPYTGETQNL